VAGFWGTELKLVPTRANGQPAFAYYLPDPTTSVSRANGLIVLTISGDRVATVTRFGGADVIARFGLPQTVARNPLCMTTLSSGRCRKVKEWNR
jgi:hypothetical protein